MRATDVKLSSLTEELIRLGEIMRQREPALIETGDAIVGIRRQLAAAEAPAEMKTVANDKADAKKNKSKAGRQNNRKTANSRNSSRRNNSRSRNQHAERRNSKSKRVARRSRSQLLEQLINDVEHLTLMLTSKEVASREAAEAFEKFRQTVIETASQRRKHLVDLAYLHSLVAGLKGAEASQAETETEAETETAAPKPEAAATKPTKSKKPGPAHNLSAVLVELEDMYHRCGGTIVSDYSEADKACFQISGKGANLKVLRPAYVATNADGRTMVVARGTVEGGKP